MHPAIPLPPSIVRTPQPATNRRHVSYEACQLPHRGLPMRSPIRPAADEIGMRCKPLFYFSRGSLVFGRR